MHRPPLIDRFRNFSLLSRAASYGAILLGAGVLIGWVLGADVLKDVLRGGAAMKPNTAICFVLSGISLWLLGPARGAHGEGSARGNGAGRLCALIVAAVGLATLVEYGLNLNLGIDGLFFPNALAATHLPTPGRMAISTAVAFVLAGTALLLLGVESRRGLRPSQHLAVAEAFISLIALLGYLYGVPALYQFSTYSSMALHTSLGHILLAAGILCAHADRGPMASITSPRVGGMMARRVLPAAILLPVIMGWLRLAGQHAGWYGTEFGLALFATSNIVIFSVVVWFSARSLNRIDEERDRAKEAAGANERRFQALIERGADGIVLTDTRRKVLYTSPAGAAIQGCTVDEMYQRDDAHHIHPDDAQLLAELWDKVVNNPGVPVSGTWRSRHTSGRWLWLEGVATNLLADPAVGAIVANYRDVTDRMQAQEALRESEELFAKAFRSNPAGMIFMRLSDRCHVDVNESLLRMLGYDRDEVIGHTSEELGLTTGDNRSVLIEQLLATGALHEMETEVRTKQGEIRNVLISAHIVMVHSEPHSLTAVMDITERKLAEAARARLESQLLQSQKMEALGTLASGIAHDFNNVLTAIVGNAQLAREDLAPDHPAQRSLSEVYKAGVRAADLVKRILTFSRQQEPKRSVIKLRSVVEEALELLRATLPAMIEIRTDFSPEITTISADPTQIHQIIMNLGTNAAHAMGRTGGVLTVALEPVVIDAELASTTAALREGRYVRLSVTDNGCGIEQTVLSRIFEPFFTTKSQDQGTGLGLSVVHGIVQSHGGAVTVYSELGRGTAFRLYFPAAGDAAHATPAPTANVAPEGRERVLYVDDEPSIVLLVTRMLERTGYRVTGYTDPSQALQAFRSRSGDFDVVITDLSMPSMSGHDLARTLLEIRPSIPIVLTSGFVDDAEIASARSIGIRAFVPKPIILDVLVKTLNDLSSGTISPSLL